MKCGMRKIITVIVLHVCAKGFLDLNFNKAVIQKISIFHEIAPKFTYSQKSCNFLSMIGFF